MVPVAWHPSFTHWHVVVLQSIVPQWQAVNVPGVHAAPAGHEHAPHAHPLEQVCVPYVLHAWVAPGEQVAPAGQEHAPQPHDAEHVSLPYVLHTWVAPDAHAP